MAITRPDAATLYFVSDAEADATVDFSHTTTANTTLLTVSTHAQSDKVVTGITFNGSAMTSLYTQASTDSSDAGLRVFALANPAIGTHTVSITYSSAPGNWNAATAINWKGTVTTSTAAAIQFISDDENTAPSATNVHAEGGTTGNTLVLFGTSIGDDQIPASNDATFTEVVEENSGGGAGGGTDGSFYVAEKIGGAPSAITVTWSASDEGTTALFEIVPAAEAGGIIQQAYNHYQHNLG